MHCAKEGGRKRSASRLVKWRETEREDGWKRGVKRGDSGTIAR